MSPAMPSSAPKTCNWSIRMRADWRTASSGVIAPLVSIVITSLSRSVRCSTRAASTAYDTPLDRRERRVHDDAANRLRMIVAERTHVARHVAAALLDLDLHLQVATAGQMRDDVVRVHDLDIVRQLDVARRSQRPRLPCAASA